MPRTVGDFGEFGLIDRLARILPTSAAIVEPIGDDCAVVRVGDRLLLASSDMFVEDVHFRRDRTPADAIGWKAAVAALSDIAAMGGAPVFCLISIACPGDLRVSFIEEIYRGLSSAMSRFGAVVAGGDTARSLDRLVIDVAIIGQVLGSRCLRRKGAKVGDLLAVTGFPGSAAAGLHALEHGAADRDAGRALAEIHQRPRPRLREAQWLCNRTAVHAMIDVTDGLAQDAGHIADSSGLGVDIDPASIPVDEALAAYCAEHGLDPRHLALTGGEDYELCFAIDPNDQNQMAEAFRHEFHTEVSIVGRFTDAWQGFRIAGQVSDIRGYDHFRTTPDA